jgi:hypothetical protein
VHNGHEVGVRPGRRRHCRQHGASVERCPSDPQRSVSAQGLDGSPVADLGPGGGQGPAWGTSMAGIGQTGAFGGCKHSRIGRESGMHGFEAFTEVKRISWS